MKNILFFRFLPAASALLFIVLFSPFCGAASLWTDTDAWLIRDAVEKQVKRIIPENKNKSKIRYEISETFSHPQENRLRNEITIFVPPAESPLYYQTDFVRRLIARMVLIRLGYSPMIADAITGHWVIRGLAYGILQTVPFHAKEQSIDHPLAIAGVYASFDVFPELESVTANLPADLPPALSCWNDEYAWLLLQLCRSGMSKDFFSVLLKETAAGKDNFPWKTFEKAYRTMRRAEKGKKAQNETPQQWFRRCMKDKLLTNRNPSKSVTMESLIQTLSFCPVQGKDDAIHYYAMEDLPLHEAELKDWRGDLLKQVQRIMAGSCFFGRAEICLEKIKQTAGRKSSAEETSTQLRQLHADLEDSIQQVADLEEYLDDAEERFVPFEVRYARLIRSAQALQDETPLPSNIELLLDKREMNHE